MARGDKMKEFFIKNKNNIIKISIIVGIVLCIFGIMNRIFELTVFNLFRNLTLPYIKASYEESKKLFVTLSLLKGVADVIEGSTVNVSMILGMDIQVGDVIQPIYDIINAIWKVALASVVVLKLETIYFEIFKAKIGSFLIFLSLITILPYMFFNNRITEILKQVSKYIILIFLFIYVMLPGGILLSSAISSYFELEYKKPAIMKLDNSLDRLNRVKDDLFRLEQSKSIFNIPGQIESAKNKIDNFGKEINNVSQDMIENTPVIIGIMLLSYIILPLIIIFLLYNLIKIIFFSRISK